MKIECWCIVFDQLITTGKTQKWGCRNKKSTVLLGEIKWNGAWRQYCYFPLVRAVHSTGCLQDISDFIGQLSKVRKEKP